MMSPAANHELTLRVLALYRDGNTQDSIGRTLGISASAVRYHLRKSGVAGKQLQKRKVYPAKNGKRRCAVCHETKPLSAFPNIRSGVCQACYKSNW